MIDCSTLSDRDIAVAADVIRGAAPGPQALSHVSGSTHRIGAMAIVAHDLRGPLANLALLVEGMADAGHHGRTDRITKLAERAELLIGRLDGMLTGLVRRTREVGDPLAMTPAAVDLVDVVETVVTLNQGLAERNGVRLHAYVAEPLGMTGDGDLLLQAIDNLVNNAIKHTRRGGSVICEAGPDDGGGIILNVIDEGPGLTEADLARAFRPFTRLSSRRERPADSNGLGLWIVRLIAEMHGGSVAARDRGRARGSIFTLRLPCSPPNARSQS